MRKKIILMAIVIILFMIIAVKIVGNYIISPQLQYCQEYVPGTGNIKGDVDTEYFANLNEDFEIGANSYGYAVFKNPKAAFKTLKEDYAPGIKLIRNEFKLVPLTQFNYQTYGTYGWQATTGTDEEQAQASFVSGFMDIYENSFSK